MTKNINVFATLENRGTAVRVKCILGFQQNEQHLFLPFVLSLASLLLPNCSPAGLEVFEAAFLEVSTFFISHFLSSTSFLFCLSPSQKSRRVNEEGRMRKRILTKWAASLFSFSTFPAQSSLAQALSDCGFCGNKLFLCLLHCFPLLPVSLPKVKEGDGGGTDEQKFGGRAHYVLHLLPESFLYTHIFG